MRSLGKTTLRKLTYGGLLMLSLFSIHPSLAAAQEVTGSFTLPHEVRWQNRTISAGEYTFVLEGTGAMQTLIVRNVSNFGSSAILLVDGVQRPHANESSQLSLISRNGQSFVRSLALPEFDMVLQFKVPAEATPTQISANSVPSGISNQ